jgi:hypothetical protein
MAALSNIITPTNILTAANTVTLTNKTINATNNTITNVSLTTGVAGTLPVANGGTGVTTSTGTGDVVLSTSPTLVTPALGTPASGVVTNLTGTASININGTVGATTANTGAFTTLSATGVTTVQAGSAAAPAITTSGDTNTGIFFPAADTIAFAEGGVEAMRLDAAGNMGLGVTPSAWAAGQSAMQFKSGGLSAWALSGSNGYIYSNAYYDGSNNRYVNTGAACSYAINNGSGAHTWFTAPSGTAGNVITFTQRLTLDVSGNLTASGNVTAYSDERVKTNWRGYGPDFIERLAKIKHGTFDRTDTELTQDGVSAQSLQELLPHSVMEDKEGRLSVAYGNAALIAAVKLAERVVALEARLAALEAKG